MPKFRITFSGRRKGALGLSRTFVETVEALDEEQAVLKLYDTHEHVNFPQVQRLLSPTTAPADGEGR